MKLSKKIFHPKDWVDDAYELTILIKALGGLVECITGIALLFISVQQIQQFVTWLTHLELLEDPHDLIANHLTRWSHHIGGNATLYVSIYLLAHGILKIGIVGALMFKKRWAYPAAITIFSGFAIYQIYLTIHKVSIGYALLTLYDVLVIYLVWLEYRKVLSSAEGNGK
jgi:uncharacterized membrane protein